MKKILLHDDADSKTLGFARIFVFTIVFLHVFFDRTLALSYLDPGLFFPQGIFKFIPSDYWIGINSAGFLLTFKILLLTFLTGSIFGANKLSLHTSYLGFAIFLGIEKGFGGHVDHRELFLVYIMFSLSLTPCLDSLSLQKPDLQNEKTPQVYKASMLLILLVPILEYVYIGVARLFIGFPEVFHPEIMKGWILHGMIRPTRFPSTGIGAYYLSQSWLNWTLYFILAFSTVLELLALLFPFLKKWPKRLLIFSLIGFHISIFLIMNIIFIENITILLLFFNYTPLLNRILKPFQAEGQVFYDKNCAISNSLVKSIVSSGGAANLSFNYLDTFPKAEIGKVSDSFIVFQDKGTGKQYFRSDALLRTLAASGSTYSFFWIFILIPKFFRDLGYWVFSKYRYSIFGKTN
ncbi:DCC1-like thiol-disulfide oxidoreductase family protein [Leptospira koniambonensis]|uniref:DCC1-like thiol-disulfide oxidoreductase family protein n=1 Tax=Leptospira koniambonensis TaxID=2484950 RepID=UPI003EB9ACD0